MRPFDVCGELPNGTTVLEASAGTGKTFAVAGLAARLVAEGYCELSDLLLVTFSRAATEELRVRVRDRLVSVHRALTDPAAARATDRDEVARLLVAGSEQDLEGRRRRLAGALADFDAATIATTHGFASQMLAELGVAGNLEPGLTLAEQTADLVAEVVDDLYLRRYGLPGSPEPVVERRLAHELAAQAVGDRQARLAPSDAPEESPARARVEFAEAARREVAVRKRDRRLFDYDDLLTRLCAALSDPTTGGVARQRLRRRYRYVLVDEFQDTDPVQWRILRLAFHGHATVVLVGDPKQAIYAFRGADLPAYLDAVQVATGHLTLDRNWRSDEPLLRGLAGLFGGVALGHPRIVAGPVVAARGAGCRLDASAGQPLRLRVVGRAGFGLAGRQNPSVKEVRPWVARDVAADIARLLATPPVLRRDDGPARLAAGDVAVLVRTNAAADLVREALVGAGVPAVLTGSRSVFRSPPATDWLVLLRALERPHRAGLVRAAALTDFVGWDVPRLAGATDPELDGLARRIRDWRAVLVDRGVAALLEVIGSQERLPQRLLGRAGGERDLTDLRHVGQVLHEAAVTGRLGPAGLLGWLRRRLAEATGDDTEERSRRLDTDADAVQVVTVHASKGLQFPVVYVPFAWDRYEPSGQRYFRCHDEDGQRVLDVGGAGVPGYPARRKASQQEEAGEDLRLLYVAATRACCQLVLWWAPTRNTRTSALHRLLFGDRVDGSPVPEVSVPDDHAVRSRLVDWATGIGPVAIEDAMPADAPRPSSGPSPADELAAASFDRALDASWRRTSYTGLTFAAHQDAGAVGVGVDSEPPAVERADEPPAAAVPGLDPAADGAADPAADRMRAVVSPMALLPAGAALGTVVHAVLEQLDTAAPDIGGQLRARCAAALAGRGLAGVTPEALAAALEPALRTRLGPLCGDRCLLDVPPADRLAELAFELPLAGGQQPRGDSPTLAAVADALRADLPPGHPLDGYPDRLTDPALSGAVLRGYLAGTIDAVLRVPAGPAGWRYLVVDYKTNWLGTGAPAAAGGLTAWDYRPEALAVAMVRAHYPLQALLYTVALHRYLRWRQPSYEPAVHLGGVLYLFLRGMCGPATPVVAGSPTGVFGWRPSAELVVGLSDLLDWGPS